MAAVGSEISTEVELVKGTDRDHGCYQVRLLARMRAVIQSQAAMAAGEPGARFAFRQSLVDLAAVSELIAAELPAPGLNRPARR